MRFLRRGRHWIIVLVMLGLCGAALPATAAPGDDLRGTRYETPANAMYSAGMLSLDWVISLRPDALLTHAEEAQLLTLAIAGSGNAAGFLPLRFPDVPTNHWAKGYIDTAVWLRLVPGTANVAFGPDKPVTGGQLADDILRLCGAPAASLNAAWSDARARGLTDSQAATYASITRGEALIIAYRAFFGLTVPALGGTLAQRVHGQGARITPPGESGPTMEVHLLPGNVTLVRLPSGADWLIDTGSSGAMAGAADYLAALGINYLDRLIITGESASPALGRLELSRRLTARSVVRCDSLLAVGLDLPAGLLSADADVTLEVIAVPPVTTGVASGAALRLTRGDNSILLTAGLSAVAERALLTPTTVLTAVGGPQTAAPPTTTTVPITPTAPAAPVPADLTAAYWRAPALASYETRDLALLQAVAPTRMIIDGGEGERMLTALTAAGISVSDPVREKAVVLSFGAADVTIRTAQPPAPTGMTLAGRRDDSYYHRPTCTRLAGLSETSLRWFRDAADARLRGFRACPVCGGR